MTRWVNALSTNLERNYVERTFIGNRCDHLFTLYRYCREIVVVVAVKRGRVGREESLVDGLTKINPHALLLVQLPPNLEIESDVRDTHKVTFVTCCCWCHGNRKPENFRWM